MKNRLLTVALVAPALTTALTMGAGVASAAPVLTPAFTPASVTVADRQGDEQILNGHGDPSQDLLDAADLRQVQYDVTDTDLVVTMTVQHFTQDATLNGASTEVKFLRLGKKGTAPKSATLGFRVTAGGAPYGDAGVFGGLVACGGGVEASADPTANTYTLRVPKTCLPGTTAIRAQALALSWVEAEDGDPYRRVIADRNNLNHTLRIR